MTPAPMVAAIDAGTNTMRLYLAQVEADGSLRERCRLVDFVGLGEGVDATGRLRPDAVARALATCARYARLIREARCERVRFVATSATRDASNRDELLDGVRRTLGPQAQIDVVTGEQEAQLSFAGAAAGVALTGEPVLVMDAGGGSTEVVRGDADGHVSAAISVNVGSRRIRERYLADDPPTSAQIEAARAGVDEALDRAGVGDQEVGTFIGVAGTVTSMAAVWLGLMRYDRARVHGARMPLTAVADVAERLLGLSAAQITELGPVQPERAPLLAPGALVVAQIAARVRTGALVVSEADILDGIARSLLDA